MKQFQDKKKIRRRVYSKASIIFLIIIFFTLVKAVFNIYGKEVESRKDKTLSTEKLFELKDREQKLESQTESLKTDVGIEEEIRSKFSVVRPGEEMIVVVPKEKIIESTSTPSWFERLKDKIKSFF